MYVCTYVCMYVQNSVCTMHVHVHVVCSDKMIVLAVAIYCVVSFAIISMDEIYSVWCATDTDLG